MLKGQNLQLRLFYQARILLIFKGKIKSFIDKQELREFRIINQLYNKF